MHKSNLLNLVLLIAVISLASLIYFSEEENTELEKFSTTDINSITSITIKHNDNSTILIKNIENRKDHQWLITEPVNISANDFRVNSILKLLNAPVHNKYSTEEINLSSIGLANSNTTISFNGETIAFGIVNPATNLRYVKYGETIYTIEDFYYPLLSSTFGTLVSLNLIADSSKIEKLILLNQTISKNDKGFWQSNINISADNINKTIDHWLQDQAFGVHEYIPRKSLGDVFIYLNDTQQVISYMITDTDPWLILARPELGLEFHLEKDAYDNLIQPQ